VDCKKNPCNFTFFQHYILMYIIIPCEQNVCHYLCNGSMFNIFHNPQNYHCANNFITMDINYKIIPSTIDMLQFKITLIEFKL